MSATGDLVATLAIALLLTALTPTILTALPAPAGEPASPYRPLATRRVAAWTGAVAGTMTWLVLHALPAGAWPVWLVLSTIGALAICIDELTCWLPKRLTDLATALALTGLALAGAAGWIGTGALLGSLGGGAGMWLVFWLIWRLGGAMGYGDVRLALLCGLGAGMFGTSTVLAAALAGTILPIIFALVAHPGEKHFPYGPGLLLGTLIAVMGWH